MELKPQDIVVAIYLAFANPPPGFGGRVRSAPSINNPLSRRAVSERLGLSLGEVANCYKRLHFLGLIGSVGVMALEETVNRRALREFLVYGVKYYSRPSVVGVGPGMATGWSAPLVSGMSMMVPPETPLVWAGSNGPIRGEQITPIHKSAVHLAQASEEAYAVLALVDVMRVGSFREQEEAKKLLLEIFKD